MPAPLPSPGRSFLELRPFSAEEINSLLQDLKRQRDSFAKAQRDRERDQTRFQLARRELVEERAEIERLRQSVTDSWAELRQAREAFSQRVTELTAIEARNLKQVAQTYEGMDAARSAAILAKLNVDVAVKTLHLMRERNAAEVLQALDDDVAAQLTERLMFVKKADS